MQLMQHCFSKDVIYITCMQHRIIRYIMIIYCFWWFTFKSWTKKLPHACLEGCLTWSVSRNGPLLKVIDPPMISIIPRRPLLWFRSQNAETRPPKKDTSKNWTWIRSTLGHFHFEMMETPKWLVFFFWWSDYPRIRIYWDPFGLRSVFTGGCQHNENRSTGCARHSVSFSDVSCNTKQLLPS